ncbi:MAG: hypothetical protein IPM29_05195 [Planctomycetes bacterium]|nr:hypothetical protein [Planctomycetota bacterium]
MQIASSSLLCEPQGDSWSPLEFGQFNAWQLAVPANVPRAASPSVRMWLKGVKITGTVTANGPDAANWHFGIIQIIKKAPVMVATYENKLYRRWFQVNTPCFDSDSPNSTPWYNLGSRGVLAPGAAVSVTLEDYPTSIASMSHTATGKSGRLLEVRKRLDFDVFLAVRPKTAEKRDAGLLILQQLEWSTETWVKLTWNAAGKWTATASTFTRSPVSDTDGTAVSADESKALIAKFPLSNSGANATITTLDQ